MIGVTVGLGPIIGSSASGGAQTLVSTPGKVIAFVFAITAFALAIFVGMAAGDSAEAVLGRALLVLFVCHLIGLAIGGAITHVLNEYLRKYEAEHPIPDVVPVKNSNGAEPAGSGAAASRS